MKPEDVRRLATALPETVEGAHSGHPDFRVGGRIFATLWVDEERVVLRLGPAEQAAWIEAEPDLFEPLDGAWGRRGWTSLALWDAGETILAQALLAAWRGVAADAYDRI
ncbi:MmcQ/YjbR family DNA-binding protein [Methylobacterium sp. J-068]|uniref:MmcQ/YjbR family DNA-binding protein n=1 Tax=Methylobacterium sp. J-068 TaxID=2836649 RepID=UPI001FB8A4BB|nr:MmcQ/YjbR family DNA-binding protein [Methylobacterium sp. J-068]MCJ2033629.1 MmcQ/YjbR family DNA-binding protein [Methylobacterium sp. J-068]